MHFITLIAVPKFILNVQVYRIQSLTPRNPCNTFLSGLLLGNNFLSEILVIIVIFCLHPGVVHRASFMSCTLHYSCLLLDTLPHTLSYNNIFYPDVLPAVCSGSSAVVSSATRRNRVKTIELFLFYPINIIIKMMCDCCCCCALLNKYLTVCIEST